MTTVQAHQVVTLQFSLKDQSGTLLDEAPVDHPHVYLHGAGNLHPVMERLLDGMSVGEKKEVSLAAKDAFGERDPSLVEKVGRHHLGKGAKRVRVGDMLTMESKDGSTHEGWVLALTPVTVTLDFNHRLAGMALQVSLHVLSTREATAEERDHGHVHDPEHPHDHDHGEDAEPQVS